MQPSSLLRYYHRPPGMSVPVDSTSQWITVPSSDRSFDIFSGNRADPSKSQWTTEPLRIASGACEVEAETCGAGTAWDEVSGTCEGSAVTKELLHRFAGWALGAATIESQQVFFAFRASQTAFEAALSAAVMCACLVFLHRIVGCTTSGGAKFGSSNFVHAFARRAVEEPSRRFLGLQRASALLLLLLLLGVPTTTGASSPLDGLHADAEHRHVAATPSSLSGTDFTHVIDEHMDFKLLSARQHGRTLSSGCVRIAFFHEPLTLCTHSEATSVLDSHVVLIFCHASTTVCTCSDAQTLLGPLGRTR